MTANAARPNLPAVRTEPREPNTLETLETHVLATIRRLRDRYAAISPELIETRVRAWYARFADAPVRDFVPILVEREIREEFRRVPGRLDR